MKILRGKVIHGKKRGRKLGYPTANIRLKKDIESGIYVSVLRLKKVNLPAVTFIGNATTFDEKEIYCETHILNFSKNIYNAWVKVRLLQKIRGNEKFHGEADLIIKMKKDVEYTRRYFNIY